MLNAALGSLWDSLNALFVRMPNTNSDGNWVARLMMRIGEIQQRDVSESDAKISAAHEFAAAASGTDPFDAEQIRALLRDIEAFLTDI